MIQNGQSETWLTQQMGHYEFMTTIKHYISKIKSSIDLLDNLKIS